MSIARNIEMAVGLAILLAIAGLFGYGKWQSWRKDVAQEHYQVANGDAKAYETKAVGTKRIAEQEQRTHESLERALEANPAWADQPVPTDVARVLCHSPDAACQSPSPDSDH